MSDWRLTFLYICSAVLLALMSVGDGHTTAVVPTSTVTNLTNVTTPNVTSPSTTNSSTLTTSNGTGTTISMTTVTSTTQRPTTAEQNSTGSSVATTSVSSTTSNPNITTAWTPSTTTKSSKSGAAFDLASFLGGILLGVGVVVIGLFAWKCYQRRNQSRIPYNAMVE